MASSFMRASLCRGSNVLKMKNQSTEGTCVNSIAPFILLHSYYSLPTCPSSKLPGGVPGRTTLTNFILNLVCKVGHFVEQRQTLVHPLLDHVQVGHHLMLTIRVDVMSAKTCCIFLMIFPSKHTNNGSIGRMAKWRFGFVATCKHNCIDLVIV